MINHLKANPGAGMAKVPVVAQVPAPPTLNSIEIAQAKLVEASERQRHEELQAERRSMGLPIQPFPPDVERRRAREAAEDASAAAEGEIVERQAEEPSVLDDRAPIDIAVADADPPAKQEKKKRVSAAQRKADKEAAALKSDADAAFSALEALSENDSD